MRERERIEKSEKKKMEVGDETEKRERDVERGEKMTEIVEKERERIEKGGKKKMEAVKEQRREKGERKR